MCVHRVRSREVTCCFRPIRKWPSRSAEIWSTSISYRSVAFSLCTLFTKVLSFKRKWFDVRLVIALQRGCRRRLVVVDCISCPQEQLGFFRFVKHSPLIIIIFFTIFGVRKGKKIDFCCWDGSLLCAGSSWRVVFRNVKCYLQNTTQIMKGTSWDGGPQ